jgi:hypothetical protein
MWKDKPVVASKTPPYLEIAGERYFAVVITCGGVKQEGESRRLYYSSEQDSRDAFEKMWGDLEFPCLRRRVETTAIPVKFGYEYWPKEKGDPKYKFDNIENPNQKHEFIYSTIARVWLPERHNLVIQYKKAA